MQAEPDAEAVATAVLGVPGVVAMSHGPFGQFRSYLPGGRTVPGVRFDDDRVDVNIVAEFGVALLDVGAAIQRLVAPQVGGRPVHVHIDDVVTPGEVSPDAADSIVEQAPDPRSTSSAEASPTTDAPPTTDEGSGTTP